MNVSQCAPKSMHCGEANNPALGLAKLGQLVQMLICTSESGLRTNWRVIKPSGNGVRLGCLGKVYFGASS